MFDAGSSNIPLSPPTSPRMSQYHAESVDSAWQEHQSKQLEATPDSATGEMALVHSSMPSLDLDVNRKPLLRSHKSFPYPLQTSRNNIHEPDTPPLNSTDGSPTSNVEGLGISNLPDSQPNEMTTVSFGGSAPASPMSNLSPNSPIKDGSQDQQDLNGLNIDMDDLGDDHDEKQPMTAAEIRAQKRKMKRFRLTHNQTRFLMSEFARQAHPDAAHRERLAREIPGLSPRQVQVWFQNRRAKLKRLTSDDRQRMMQSRALPDDFDMTQALHSPFGAGHGVGSSLNSPSNYTPAFPEGNMIRPLNLDTLRRDNSHHMSQSGITPAFGGFNFTPPQSVTDTLSPVSPSGGESPYSYSPTLEGSPRRSNPFAAGVASPSTFTSHPQIPRLQLHDRSVNRSRPESLNSPLRTSMSYGGHDGRDGMSNSMHNSTLGNDSNGQNNGMLPYGLGYSYSSIPGFQATSNSRMRSFSNGLPRRIELGQGNTNNSSYQSNRGAPTPQTSSFPHYTSSPMATPNNFMMSAPHHVTSFPSTYMRQDGSPSEPFPSVDSLIGDNDSNHNGESGENNDGSIPSLASF